MIPETITFTIPGDAALLVGGVALFLLGVWLGWEWRAATHPAEIRFIQLPERPKPPRTMDDARRNLDDK